MISYSIYIVDDEESLAKGIAFSLQKDYQARPFLTAEAALAAVKENPPDLILLDISLPGKNGIEALREIKENYPDILVIMITAFEEIETVITAMRLGAYDYVVKPIKLDTLEVSIRNALETIRLKKEVKILQEKYLHENLPFFSGRSREIQDVMQLAESVSKSPDTTVLILGESGSGKELIANFIHFKSPNFEGPLITVNCAAIPKDLLESELFGYEKGAFSGARSSGKQGLIEQATGGSLFLDEIGDLSPDAQAKLLRFLESGEFYKVGGTSKIKVNTRLITATNKNLDEMMQKGLFREDLYFRIGVVKIEIPSLNQRTEDILPIAKHFLMEFSKKFGKTFTSITPEAENALQRYHWRGNVRELKNVIERATLIANGPALTLQDLAIKASSPLEDTMLTPDKAPPFIPAEGVDLPNILKSIEKKYIVEALRISGANETKAAELLNLKYSTLRFRKKKHAAH